ncbi:MAG: hypothetical protein K2P42_05800 [Lachnospiraceae bacterium]|jgi:hypothetical protein|nr:hypothetical protein [Lachnospiraceae bacterium]MDE6990152.1 hypothetical protein [Lachnospiraceae bacterium]
MISYEELIYSFVDVYLKTAVECSICKENYAMGDDTAFLDEYMKLFVSLLLAVEQDENLELETVKKTLEQRKQEKITEIQTFLREQVLETAMESVKKEGFDAGILIDSDAYVKEIQRIYSQIFDSGIANVKDNPIELLRYIRTKEENL